MPWVLKGRRAAVAEPFNPVVLTVPPVLVHPVGKGAVSNPGLVINCAALAIDAVSKDAAIWDRIT
jgi:hypothetical protein